MKRTLVIAAAGGIVMSSGCITLRAATFGEDVAFLKKHTEVVVLSDAAGKGQVAVLPKLQGRIMTSTAEGDSGLSYGWINRELLASGKTQEHINVYGGEDRFWLGPEGGQYSIFFKKGVPFDLAHWFTPAPFDTEPFDTLTSSKSSVAMQKNMALENYSGTKFKLQVNREVRLLAPATAVKALGTQPGPAVRMVAFESDNRITNQGKEPWTPETGLVSIWILGMFNPTDAITIVIPFQTGANEKLGPIVNDAYFGKVPEDRLKVKDGVLFFRGDGKFRSKIGLSPKRAKSVAGSYDARNGVLTIVQYNQPAGAIDYVNSMWEIQKAPYGGDAINSYNDGPATPGAKPLGPFYELETSSPAAALKPGEKMSHTHRTFHLQGTEAELDPVAKAILGVSLADIKSAF